MKRNLLLALSMTLALTACQAPRQADDFSLSGSLTADQQKQIFASDASLPDKAIPLTRAGTTAARADYYYQNPITQFIDFANRVFQYNPQLSQIGWMTLRNDQAITYFTGGTNNYYQPAPICQTWHIVLTESAGHQLLPGPISYNATSWVQPSPNVLQMDYRLQGVGGFLFAITPSNGTQNSLKVDVSTSDCSTTTGAAPVAVTQTQDLTPFVNSTGYVQFSSEPVTLSSSTLGSTPNTGTLTGRYIGNGGYQYNNWYQW